MSHPPNSRSSSLASGTKSLIFGVRPSVRLPRRTVASCVSDPIGAPRPLFTASTPAMNVVLTAPIPGSKTPSLPSAGAIRTLSMPATGAVCSDLPESRRKISPEGLLGMQDAGALEQHLFGFGIIGIGDTAIDGADRGALLLVEEADALGALDGRDVIDVLLQWGIGRAVEFPVGAAFINRGVRALGLACAAVDTFLGDQGGHPENAPATNRRSSPLLLRR